MDASEHRRARLRAWLDQEFEGKIVNLVRRYDFPRSMASYISQILSGTRPFGERAARNLEAQCNRPPGWLDLGLEPPDPGEVFRYDRRLCAQLGADDRELIEQFIALIVARSDRSSGKRRALTAKVVHSSPLRAEAQAVLKQKIGRTYNDHGKPPQPKTTRTKRHS